jgi:hypothetical protein
VSSRDVAVYLILGAGLLALSIGAFGLLDALNGHRRGSRWVALLIGVYALGVLASAFSLALAGRWYLGVPLVLMLIPADVALRKNGTFRRRTAAARMIMNDGRGRRRNG